ncbi:MULTISPECIES: hypothetical protein [unclassified Brenneria]|uniref:hypothetical protein n=1 Tax=unclassified Brenneria TaxID=2634434 RepID=UPI0018F06D0E|nr:hypothetical protein [Brenneria sp. L3-3C-1]MBJ7221475.1 hypothetical protein [Brenneria sp. L3-3C-1]MEE3642717.1 hypothetical protein [Brenneria sp. L3_3C_1]
MKLEKAYSEELNRNITAEEADHYFAKGVISSKFAFTCPDEHCDAPVTCANLDKKKEKRKRDPYYKVVGAHKDDCLIKKETTPENKRITEEGDLYSASDEYVEGAIRLDLRPASSKRPASDEPASGSESATNIRRPNDSAEHGKRKIQHSKTLSSMVTTFLNKENIIVQLPGVGTLPINDLFIEIAGQDISTFDDEYRIYYGTAWINKVEKGFSVRFANTLKHGELVARPSFFIPLADTENATYGKFKVATLNKLANKLPKTVFILCETGPNLKENKYINFWLDGLEYMDYRIS